MNKFFIVILPLFILKINAQTTFTIKDNYNNFVDVSYTVIDANNNYVAIGNKSGSAFFAPTAVSSFYIHSSINYENTTYSVKSIGKSAFASCSNMYSVTIPNSITSIGVGAFYGCGKLSKIQLPNSVTAIGNNAFMRCFNLKTINIPASCNAIGEGAFSACTGLVSIHVYNSNPSNINLGASVFSSNVPISTCILYVPKGTKSLYEVADQWKDFTNIIEEDVTSKIEPVLTSELCISVLNSRLFLSSVVIGQSIQVLTLDGRYIYNEIASSNSFTITIPNSGIYILRVGSKVTKILLN